MSYDKNSHQDLQSALLECSSLLDSKIDKILPNISDHSRLIKAMRYCVISAGKRIRPFLVINSASIFNISKTQALNAAIAIEFVHTYSLIHDDLPAMDDDDMRRGKLSCHKKFDEATAILAGDAFLTYAFEILSDITTHEDPNIRCQLISSLAKASGFKGMVGGQMMDLEKSDTKISYEELIKLHSLKTSELFISCVEVGAILGKASAVEKKALQNFANDIGLAFQIKDDILDHHPNEDVSNSRIDSTSIVKIVGLSAAQKKLKILKSQAINHLSIFEEKATQLINLAEFVINRDN